MPDPIARKRPTAETFDVSAFPPLNNGGPLNVYAMENALPEAPNDVAAFPHDVGGGPNADEGVGPTTPCQAIIMHDSSSQSLFTLDPLLVGNVFTRVVVQGSEGDECSLILFSGGASDSYVELRIRIGDEGRGQIRLRRVHGGAEVDGWTEDEECDRNSYSLPPATPITLRLCNVQFPTLSIAGPQNAHGSVTVGSDTYELGNPGLQVYGDNDLGSGIRAGLCVANGSGVTFDNFEFYGAYVPQDSSPATGCEVCWVCDYQEWTSEASAAGALTNWTQAAGAWAESTHGCLSYGAHTTDSNALLIHTRRWVNDNMRYKVYGCMLGNVPVKYRLIFSYIDASNFWCLEARVTEYEPNPSNTCRVAMRLIRVIGGVETIEATAWLEEFLYPLDGSLEGNIDIAVYVQDCLVYFGLANETIGGCLENADLNDTGIFGVGTGNESAGDVAFGFLEVSCGQSFTCTGGQTDADPPPDPDPGPTGCCSDIDLLTVGDALELTLSGITYFLIAPCPAVCGDGAYITALNATHTATILFKTDVHIIAYCDTGLTTDCNGLDVSAKIWLTITKISATECEARAELRFGENVCSILFYYGPFAGIPIICDGTLALTVDSALMTSIGLEPKNCCLQAPSAGLTVNVP